MTKQECEARLFDLMEQAKAIIQEYDPNVNHFSMFTVNDYTRVQGGFDKGDGEIDEYSVEAYRWSEVRKHEAAAV